MGIQQITKCMKESQTKERCRTKIKVSQRTTKRFMYSITCSWETLNLKQHSCLCLCITSFNQNKTQILWYIVRIQFEYWMANDKRDFTIQSEKLDFLTHTIIKLLRFALPNRLRLLFYLIHPSKINLVTFECAVQFGSIYD